MQSHKRKSHSNSGGYGLCSVRDPRSVYLVASTSPAHGFQLLIQEGFSNKSIMFTFQSAGRKKEISLVEHFLKVTCSFPFTKIKIKNKGTKA